MPTPTEWVVRQQASGLCPHRFARVNDIPKTTFYGWLRRYQESATAVQFIDVTPQRLPKPAPLRIYLSEQPVSIDVDTETDLYLLRRVIDALC